MDVDPQSMMPLIGIVFGLVVVGAIVTAIVRLVTAQGFGGRAADRRRTDGATSDPLFFGAAALGVASTTGGATDPDPRRDDSSGSSTDGSGGTGGDRGASDGGWFGGSDGGGFSGGDGGGFSGGDGGGSF